jgi:hypothetical protein
MCAGVAVLLGPPTVGLGGYGGKIRREALLSRANVCPLCMLLGDYFCV